MSRSARRAVKPALSLAIFVGVAIATTLSPASALAAVGTITTVAGNGTDGYTGDNGPATAAELSFPHTLSPLRGGGFLIGDYGNSVIRRVFPSGTITTVAGGASTVCLAATDPLGDGCPATQATLSGSWGVAVLPGGGFLIADVDNDRIRKVSASGTITTVAGGASAVCPAATDFSGDGCPATSAALEQPTGVAPLPGGGFLIAGGSENKIRKVSASGTITTVAGDLSPACPQKTDELGDGCPATSAFLARPEAVAPLAGGGFLIADAGHNLIRKVSPAGIITTVAGDGAAGYNGDNIPATSADLDSPHDVKPLPRGGFLVADSTASNNRVRKVSATGTITTVAGGATSVCARAIDTIGDGCLAASATLNIPTGLAFASDGGFFIVDAGENRIRRVEGFSPRTTIDRHPKARTTTRKRRVKVRFAFHSNEVRSTFECKLASAPFRRCASPRSFKVKKGRHTFQVRATNEFDRTGIPARYRFKIVRRKHRRH